MANASTDPNDRLTERLLRARVQLALRQPFLASALFRLRLVAVTDAQWCPTMATEGLHIFYNPAWLLSLTDAEIQAVLAHELLHVVMNHNARRQDRHALRWNMACDFCINAMLQGLNFQLPAGALFDPRLARLTSEEIYERLAEDKGASALPVDCMGNDLVDGNDPRVAAHRPVGAPDAEGARALRTALQGTVRQAMQAAGKGLGNLEREFMQTQEARIDWREVLQNLLQSAVKCDWASIPFARKHLHRGLYLPSVSKPAALRVVFAIDTSGSVDDRQINDIVNELMCFSALHEGPLSIVQCDSDIRHVLHINEPSGGAPPLDRLSIVGRGGTAFTPVFDWVQANAEALGELALLVYATDGLGQFPAQAPTYPVLWLLSDRSTPLQRLPFGSGARLV